jgi:hypothetical protein
VVWSTSIGAALLGVGAGFVLLALGTRRFTRQPQDWALRPGSITAIVGFGLIVLAPTGRALDLAGWVWPVLLLWLAASSFRSARRSLAGWSRRAVLYPALAVLALIAVGGALETIVQSTSSNPQLGGRTYLVDGSPLYLRCIGHGAPTVVLMSGLGERTPSWAWCSAASHRRRASAPTIAPAKAGAAGT